VTLQSQKNKTAKYVVFAIRRSNSSTYKVQN